MSNSQIDDCTQDWTFKENSADFVHVRWLVGSIPDWTALFKQAYRCLKPGAYLESHEASARVLSDDGSVHDDSALGQWGEIFIEGGRKIGRPFTVVEDDLQKKAMEAAGFIDVKVTTLKVSTPFSRKPHHNSRTSSVPSADGQRTRNSRRWGGT
jgi:ubiquinone/menaquinone biosynthesis C-methylase UbiE